MILYRFPSITSIRSSGVASGCLMATSAFDIFIANSSIKFRIVLIWGITLYSLNIPLISSWSRFVRGTVLVTAMPPFSCAKRMSLQHNTGYHLQGVCVFLTFLRTVIAGGFLFNRMPKPSNSVSRTDLSPRGFCTSRTMKIRLHVLATACCYQWQND